MGNFHYYQLSKLKFVGWPKSRGNKYLGWLSNRKMMIFGDDLNIVLSLIEENLSQGAPDFHIKIEENVSEKRITTVLRESIALQRYLSHYVYGKHAAETQCHFSCKNQPSIRRIYLLHAIVFIKNVGKSVSKVANDE